MEAFLFVWFAGVVGEITALLSGVGIVTMVLSIVIYFMRHIAWVDRHEPDLKDKPPFKFHMKISIVGMVFAFIATLLPSEKTMYLAGAAYMGQKAVQSEAADKVVKILNNKLDEYLKEAEDKLKK